MKKIKFIAGLCIFLALGGCATGFGTRIGEVFSAAQKFTVTQGQVDTARNSYDGAVLAPLNKYAELPRCKTGQKLTLNIPCHDKVLLKKIRTVDSDVDAAFKKTQNSITSGDNTGAVAAYTVLMTAIDLGKSLISQTGISVLGF